MTPEMEAALSVLRQSLSVNKMAAVSSIVYAEELGDENLSKQGIKLEDAQGWLKLELDVIGFKQRGGSE